MPLKRSLAVSLFYFFLIGSSCDTQSGVRVVVRCYLCGGVKVEVGACMLTRQWIKILLPCNDCASKASAYTTADIVQWDVLELLHVQAYYLSYPFRSTGYCNLINVEA